MNHSTGIAIGALAKPSDSRLLDSTLADVEARVSAMHDRICGLGNRVHGPRPEEAGAQGGISVAGGYYARVQRVFGTLGEMALRMDEIEKHI